jgi:hypothetical protein
MEHPQEGGTSAAVAASALPSPVAPPPLHARLPRHEMKLPMMHASRQLWPDTGGLDCLPLVKYRESARPCLCLQGAHLCPGEAEAAHPRAASLSAHALHAVSGIFKAFLSACRFRPFPPLQPRAAAPPAAQNVDIWTRPAPPPASPPAAAPPPLRRTLTSGPSSGTKLRHRSKPHGVGSSSARPGQRPTQSAQSVSWWVAMDGWRGCAATISKLQAVPLRGKRSNKERRSCHTGPTRSSTGGDSCAQKCHGLPCLGCTPGLDRCCCRGVHSKTHNSFNS